MPIGHWLKAIAMEVTDSSSIADEFLWLFVVEMTTSTLQG